MSYHKLVLHFLRQFLPAFLHPAKSQHMKKFEESNDHEDFEQHRVLAGEGMTQRDWQVTLHYDSHHHKRPRYQAGYH